MESERFSPVRDFPGEKEVKADTLPTGYPDQNAPNCQGEVKKPQLIIPVNDMTMDNVCDCDQEQEDFMSYADLRKEYGFCEFKIVATPLISISCECRTPLCPCTSVFRIAKGKPRFVIHEHYYRDLRVIKNELQIRNSLGMDTQHYSNNQLVKIISVVLDKNLVFDDESERSEILKIIYQIRELTGNTRDYGMKNNILPMESEGIADITSMIIAYIKEKATKLKESAKNVKDKIVNNFSETISEVLDWFKDKMQNLFSFVGDIGSKVFTFVFGNISVLLNKMLNPIRLATDGVMSFVKKRVFVVSVVFTILCCLLTILGVFAARLLSGLLIGIIEWFAGESEVETETYVAEGMEPVSGIVALLSLVFGLSSGTTETIAKNFRNITMICAGSVALCGIGSVILLGLPTALQTAISSVFGTDDEKERIIYEDWDIRCLAVLRLSRVNTVLSSPEFKKWVDELIKESHEIRGKIKGPSGAAVYMRNMAQLIKISNLLTVFHSRESTRNVPFSIHLFGVPGVGKTLLATKILKDCFGVETSEVYVRPKSSDYWDAYCQQTAVLYDEFLVGPAESKEKEALEYLDLISSKSFSPPMASIDDPSVGLKGTNASPKVVMSLNNAAVTHVSGIPPDALDRRRNIVVQLVPNEKFFDAKSSAVDFTKLDRDQIKQAGWLTFNIVHPKSRAILFSNLTYPDIVAMCKTQFDEHLAMCDIINDSINTTVIGAKTPQELLDDAIRDIRGIPTTKQSIGDVILKMLTKIPTVFSSEGPSTTDYETADDNKKKIKFTKTQKQQDAMLNSLNDESNTDFFKGTLTLVGNYLMKIKQDRTLTEQELAIEKKFLRKLRMFAIKWEIEQPFCGYVVDTSSNAGNERIVLQKDVVALIDHTNVDATLIHRHVCHTCGGPYAHRHEREFVHPPICGTCENAGGRVFKRSFPMPGLDVDFGILDGVPVLIDYDYPMYSEQCKNKLNILWQEYYVKSFTNYFHEPIFHMNENDTEKITFFEAVKKHSKHRLAAVGIAVTVVMGVYALKRMWGGKSCDKEFSFSGESEPPQKESRIGRRIRQPNFSRASGHAVTTKKIELCLGSVWVKGIPICDRSFLTYYHGLLDDTGSMLRPKKFKVRYLGQTYEMDYHDSFFSCSPETDMVLVKLPVSTKVPQFANIVKNFAYENEIVNMPPTSVTMTLENGNHYVDAKLTRNKSYNHHGYGRIELEDAIMYRANSIHGDCGTPISFAGSYCAGKIIGMHVAGGVVTATQEKFGLATIITRECLEELLQARAPQIMDDGAEYEAEGRVSGQNVEFCTEIPRSEFIHVPSNSTIKPSPISHLLDIPNNKAPPIVLYGGFGEPDAGLRASSAIWFKEFPKIDVSLLSEIENEMIDYYQDNLCWPVEKRNLTFEEALKGIPSILASMKVKSSPGWPLAKLTNRKGKSEFFRFEDGELKYDQDFKERVLKHEKQMMEQNWEVDNRFLMYLKDELVTKGSGKLRIIYCGDLVANTHFRMNFGSLLAAFNNSWSTTPSAIGLNQYSHDMDIIYNYLAEMGHNFLAGDYKKFDINMHPQFQKMAYNVLMTLADWVPQTYKSNFVKHQMNNTIQYKKWMWKLKSGHLSGCFFTTIVNNLVNEAYFRYVFKLQAPELIFDQVVRMKVLGDDHVVSVHEKAINRINPIVIKEALALIGQEYTSDDKVTELTEEFRNFENITFLGAHPRLVNGIYSGAVKDDTISNLLHWNKTLTPLWPENVEIALDLLSQHHITKYTEVYDQVAKALKEVDIEVPNKRYHIRRNTQCKRMAAISGNVDYGFHGQSDHTYADFVSEGPTGGIVRIDQDVPTQSGVFMNTKFLADKGLNEVSMGLNYGTESLIYRTEVQWLPTSAPGTPILTIDCPFGILNFGDPDNIQNMPFERFIYWHGNVELTIQVTGTPFHAGLLAAYFMPLVDYPCEVANITTASHVLLQPDNNTTATLTIPYRYYRSSMNTFSTTESLGTFYLAPLSELTSGDGTGVTVTIFSKFPDSHFTIPRPLPNAARVARIAIEPDIEFVAEGGVQSSVNNVYQSFSNVSGTMPIQDLSVDIAPVQDQTVDQEASIPMPFDNPPLASGAIPVHMAFDGMSTTYGPRPTVDLQLYPAAMSRQQLSIFGPEETKIDTLLGKQAMLSKVTVNVGNPPGTLLYKERFDTAFGLPAAGPDNIPINVALLNQFVFWRSDIELTFTMVRTRYHNCRLQGVIAYGAPDLVDGSRNVHFSNVMSFNNDTSTHTWLLPFNQQTEFLRTFEGYHAVDPIQNYSIGTFGLYIQNELVAPETVFQSCEVLIFIRFVNPKVAVPRAVSPFSWSGSSNYDAVLPGEYTTIQTDGFVEARVHESKLYIPLASVIYDGSIIHGKPLGDAISWSFMIEFAGILQTYTTNQLLGIQSGEVVFVTDYYYSVTPFTLRVAIPVSFWTFSNELVTINNEDEPNFIAEGGDVQEVATTEVETLMETETEHRPNIPCKLEIGSKFEFTISDILEVSRRYHSDPMLLSNTPGGRIKFTRSRTNNLREPITGVIIPVSFRDRFSGLFSAWAGSIKWRVFTDTEEIGTIMFSPATSDAVSQTSWLVEGSSRNTQFVTFPAREVMFPVPGNSYIDVSTPFQSHYNFASTNSTKEDEPTNVGILCVFAKNLITPRIYQAAGDDLRLGVYRPPRKVTFNTIGFPEGYGGFYL
ncbi:hypothetical protein [Hubei picorna-like virus 10]|uniref:hypothetical protein n=1 Tax=Hubei picorna-like virus 10 TaxID=1923089 RepID=UPI00090B6E9B|nr:hypothetical protein [Hubei picorna-like virus 10]APG77998.1 hypothetical protein [Hubei picorna-like virus 10]